MAPLQKRGLSFTSGMKPAFTSAWRKLNYADDFNAEANLTEEEARAVLAYLVSEPYRHPRRGLDDKGAFG